MSAPAKETLIEDENLLVLYIWPGDWELESIDPECLVALSFLNFSKLKHKVIIETKTLQLFKNDFPRLEYQKNTYTGLESIIGFVKSLVNIDSSLSNRNYADMFAMLTLFKEKFIPAFKILCWIDEENTYNVIRRAYGKNLRFPLSLFKIKKMSSAAENSIDSTYKSTYVKIDDLKPQILNDAKECLNIIGSRLSDRTFIFENQPTLIDAYLYGYLGILYKAPFVNSPLKSHLLYCSNLCSLITRIQRVYLSAETKLNQPNKSKQPRSKAYLIYSKFTSLFKPASAGSSQQFEQNEEWETRKSQLLAVGIGLTATIVYAFAIGLIKLDILTTYLEYTETSADD